MPVIECRDPRVVPLLTIGIEFSIVFETSDHAAIIEDSTYPRISVKTEGVT